MNIGEGVNWGINHMRRAHREVSANSTWNPMNYG